jgi:hypothetical protein
MKGLIGYPTQIVTAIPHLRQISRLSTTELSTKAKFRFEVFDWYYQKSAQYSKNGLLAATRQRVSHPLRGGVP